MATAADVAATLARALAAAKALDIPSYTGYAELHGWARHIALDLPVFPYLLFAHCLYAADRTHALTAGRQHWLKSYVLTLFAAFGGSTMAAVLSGRPAPLFTTTANLMMPMQALAWYLVNVVTPFRVVLRLRIVSAVLVYFATAAKVRSIFGAVDGMVDAFPDAWAGIVVLGGLSGCGGSLFMSLERISMYGRGSASELSAPGWPFKAAFLSAFLYYVGTDPTGLVAARVGVKVLPWTKDEVCLFVSAGLCAHAVLCTLYGSTFNPLRPVEVVLSSVLRLPTGAAAAPPVGLPPRGRAGDGAKPRPGSAVGSTTTASTASVLSGGKANTAKLRVPKKGAPAAASVSASRTSCTLGGSSSVASPSDDWSSKPRYPSTGGLTTHE